MAWNENDPARRGYGRVLRRARNGLVVLACCSLFALVVGVPGLQWSYRFHGPDRSVVATERKTAATYITPVGLKRVSSQQLGGRGCPVVAFIPLKHFFGNRAP